MMSPFHFILKCQYYYMLDISLLAILKFMIKFCVSVLKYSEKSRVSVLVSVVTCVKGQSLYACFRGYVCEGSYLRRSKGVAAVPPPCGFQASNSGPQARCEASLSAESSHWPKSIAL